MELFKGSWTKAESSVQTSTHSDLLRALVDVPDVASVPDWRQSANETVDILLLGSSPIKEKHFSHHERSDKREKVRPRVVILI
jgi:hypothetical protein